MSATVVESKVFDESYVDCNQCQHYWTDSCDGTPVAKIRPCRDFKATRETDIPLMVEKLSKGQKQSDKSILWLYIILTLHLVMEFLVSIGVL
mgnify:CR=1 FL=1